ncbi:hypothetical protein CDAR_372171 [Caerostris darwini]|uniref:Uncharacterized protein n=1 Tax=Caerostris darwini TaxID=1538125 RepID=A0AAV4VYS6_9ARAC|nr:hypothetical protein CDAR_372171 [Caerostris darwini]
MNTLKHIQSRIPKGRLSDRTQFNKKSKQSEENWVTESKRNSNILPRGRVTKANDFPERLSPSRRPAARCEPVTVNEIVTEPNYLQQR